MSKAYLSRREAERIRTEACRCTATMLHGIDPATCMPWAWSVTVFFESYIASGSGGTMKEFGPKKPPRLKPVAKPEIGA